MLEGVRAADFAYHGVVHALEASLQDGIHCFF